MQKLLVWPFVAHIPQPCVSTWFYAAAKKLVAVDPRFPAVFKVLYEEGHLTEQHKDHDLRYTV